MTIEKTREKKKKDIGHSTKKEERGCGLISLGRGVKICVKLNPTPGDREDTVELS